MSEMKTINRALVSVSDKRGIVDFAKRLEGFGVEILSTGGTKRYLTSKGVSVKPVSEHTGFPEILEGRVKTLHPKIHGGILARRKSRAHRTDMEKAGIEPIDMVVVNLYPFEKTVSAGCRLDEAIEEIDIGGPSMIRSAAKNFEDVTVVIDPSDYECIIQEMEENRGAISRATRLSLAKKVFYLTSRYDNAIFNYLDSLSNGDGFPKELLLSFHRVRELRYGENPHQRAAIYREETADYSISDARQLHGRELSFNNIIDIDSAVDIVMEFDEPSIVIIKHNNPCGVGISRAGIEDAYKKALSCDPVSAFGGIIGSNRAVKGELATVIGERFYEAVVAPGFDDEALSILSKKKNLRLIEFPPLSRTGKGGRGAAGFDIRRVRGGVLMQTEDVDDVVIGDLKVVTKRRPSKKEMDTLLFAWKVCKHVKSNAIVFARDGRTIGIGAGQMSRVDSVRIGMMKATDAGLDLKGSVMASDAFFPFKDSIEIAAEAGVRSVIQPGGSIRDEEVIESANKHDIAMVFTGMRHFRH